MGTVCIRMEESLAARMNKNIKENGYSTTTEFIREAVRKKLDQDERERLAQEFLKTAGTAKKKTTYAEERKIREQAYRELIKEKGWDN
ncbi:MAG: ribbon-helix-helix domain-containing protein [archaeon]